MDGMIKFLITGDNADFVNAMKGVQRSVKETSDMVEKEGGNIDAVLKKLAETAAKFGIAFSAVEFVKKVATVRGEFQALEQSFKVLLGSEEKANDLMQQLTKTAAITPFDLQGIAKGAKQLLAYGVEADKVNGKIVELGNLAAGLGLNLDYVTTLYGTTISKAHMDTMDLKQFKGQGIAIDEAIAKIMKVDKEYVPELVTAGKVTGEIVEKAVSQMAGVGGKFGGMMEAQSKTIVGQLSNISDAIDTMFNNIGKSNEGLISDTLSGVSYVVENYEAVGKAIAELVAAYGIYKAALIAITTYQKVAAAATIQQTVAQNAATTATTLLKNAQLALAAAMKKSGAAALANPYVLMAAAVAAAVYGIYKLITYESEEEKAIKKVEDAHKNARAEVIKETVKLSSLCDALAAATDNEEEYKEAKENLLAFADRYDPKLRDELKNVTDIKEIYEKASKAIHNYYMQKAKDAMLDEVEGDYAKAQVEAESKVYDQFEKLKKKAMSGIADPKQAAEEVRKIDAYFAEVKSAIEKGELDIGTNAGRRNYDFRAGLSADTSKWLQDAAKETKVGEDIVSMIIKQNVAYKQATKVREAAIERANALFGESETSKGEGDNKVAKAEAKNFEEIYLAAQKAWVTAKKGLDAINADRKKYTEEQYQNAVAEEKRTKEAFEKLGGNTSKKGMNDQLKAQERYAEAERKFFEQRAKEKEQLELDEIQTEINILADGGAKRLKQLELNQKKERLAARDAALERIAQIEELAKAEVEAQGKTFDAKKWRGQQGIKTDKNGNIELNTNNQVMAADGKALDAGTKYGQLLLRANEVSVKQMTNLWQVQNKQTTDAQAEALAEAQQFYGNYLKIESDFAKEKKELDKALADGTINQATYDASINAAKYSRDQALQQEGITPEIIAQKEGEVMTLIDTITQGTIDQISNALTIALQELESLGNDVDVDTKAVYIAKIKTLTTELKAAKQSKKVMTPDEKAKKKWQDLNKVVGESADVLHGVASVTKDVVSEILDAAAEIAPAVMSMITNIVALTTGGAAAMEGTSEVAAESIKTVERASVILAIISAALQIAQAMVNLFKSQSTAEAYQASRQNYEAYMEILDKVIDKNLELAESTQGDAAQNALQKSQEYYEAALETAAKQEEAARKIGKERANAGASSGSHSYGYRSVRDTTVQGWQEAAAAAGMSVEAFRSQLGGRMEGLFDLTLDQLEAIAQQAPEFLRTMDGDMQKAFNEVIQYGEKASEILSQQMEHTLGYTLDELKDDFTDLFDDLDEDGDNFAKSFSEKMKKAIISATISNEFASRLEALAKKQQEMTENDGVLDANEYKELVAEAEQIEADRKARWEQLNQEYGFDKYEQEEQTASYGGYETMSEQTGTELSGRFSAMYIVQSQQLELGRQMLEAMTSSIDILSSQYGLMQSLVTMHGTTNIILNQMNDTLQRFRIESSDALTAISKYTKNLE